MNEPKPPEPKKAAKPKKATKPKDTPKKAKTPTTAERLAEDLLRQAQELRDSSDRQERDKENLKKQPQFVTGIRAKRKLAAELEARAEKLTK